VAADDLRGWRPECCCIDRGSRRRRLGARRKRGFMPVRSNPRSTGLKGVGSSVEPARRAMHAGDVRLLGSDAALFEREGRRVTCCIDVRCRGDAAIGVGGEETFPGAGEAASFGPSSRGRATTRSASIVALGRTRRAPLENRSGVVELCKEMRRLSSSSAIASLACGPKSSSGRSSGVTSTTSTRVAPRSTKSALVNSASS
jgi:hypothetical protein